VRKTLITNNQTIMKESKQTQILLKTFLIILVLSLMIYTFVIGITAGWNFVEVAIGSVVPVSWNGQFALDFNCYLMLSVLWILWRNNYSLQSILIAPFAMTIGFIVLAPYLFYLLTVEKGDIKKVLIGNRL
jgi:hypothetical protein